jgi:hypothetical protein
MHPKMSQITREEMLARKRLRYVQAGREHKGKIITELIELFGYHRKAAIRALRPAPPPSPFVRGRPKEYEPDKLLVPLKAIWLTALQPCGKRLVSALPEWLPAYEEDHRRLNPDVKRALLNASSATLDRLLHPLRVLHRRRATTRPGTLLRQQIPIRTEWTEQSPGYLEVDTVALCGGVLDDRHSWMVDGVDIHTTWNEMRALANRGEVATVEQIRDVEQSLPFPLCGLDSDNGGEFINHHLLRYLQRRQRPVPMTRSRAYRKNDNAHIEQKNYTQVRQWFGYERYDNPDVVPLINALCKGALGQLLNFFLPTMKLESKRREGSRTIRKYGPAATPLSRVLACPEVSKQTKDRLQKARRELNPFALRRQVDRQLKEIDRHRRLTVA